MIEDTIIIGVDREEVETLSKWIRREAKRIKEVVRGKTTILEDYRQAKEILPCLEEFGVDLSNMAKTMKYEQIEEACLGIDLETVVLVELVREVQSIVIKELYFAGGLGEEEKESYRKELLSMMKLYAKIVIHLDK